MQLIGSSVFMDALGMSWTGFVQNIMSMLERWYFILFGCSFSCFSN